MEGEQQDEITDLNIELLDKSLEDQIHIRSSEDSDKTSEEEKEEEEDVAVTVHAETENNSEDINGIENEEEQENIGDETLTMQRNEIIKLLKTNKEQEKEGDRIYIIPKVWYEQFFSRSTQSADQLGPININSIAKDYDLFLLEDYNEQPYMSLPETVFIKLVEWYRMSENSKPLYTYLIKDPQTGELITEYNKAYFRIQYLKGNDTLSRVETNSQYRNVNNMNIFSVSAIDTLRTAMTRVIEFFYEIEDNLDIQKLNVKVWHVNNNGKQEEMTDNSICSTYLIDEIQFLSYNTRRHLTKDLLDEKLRDLDILSGNFVVEVIQSNKNYHWVSNALHYNKIQPGPGIMGLQNLGNTCYMNSASQCLVHIPQLRDYFLYNGYEKEINADNPLGYQGYMATAFSSLIHILFPETMGTGVHTQSAIAPTHFKSTIGHINSMFAGYLQQDSQEFLAFLLDSLHEDLNRIMDKPYIEKPALKDTDDVDDFETIKKLASDTWEKHLQRNDSVITDLFVGMYKSTLECPECSNISVTFDPYNDLTLPLPVDSIWKSNVRVFPQNSPPFTLEAELDRNATFQDLKQYIADKAEMDVNHIYGCDVFSHQFYNNFESDNSQAKFLGVRELISETDLVIFYEIQASTGDLIIPVLNTCLEDGFTSSRLFGVPFFITLSAEELNDPFILKKKLEDQYKHLSGGFINFPSYENKEDGDGVLSIDKFPLLKTKYPNADFEYYGTYLRHITLLNDEKKEDSVETKRFFDIKILGQLHERATTKSDSCTSPEKPTFWTPAGHINYRAAKDMSDFIDPVIADIYNYDKLVKEEESEDSEGNDEEMISAEEQTEQATNTDKPETTDVEEQQTMSTESPPTKDEETEAHRPCLESLFQDQFSAIVCEWNTSSVNEAFTSDKIINWERPGVLENKELQEIRKAKKENKKAIDITLGDCLQLFSKKEVLGIADSWYCPKCKEHRQASKRIQLWNTPDILLIHLKRFESSRSFADKITETVKFPITDLDMSHHVVDRDDPRGYIYDLIAVDNHFGGIGGGHYTAYVKNCVDEQWYYFNDGHVTSTVPEESIAGSAYLLFYLRRPVGQDFPGYGSERLREIINESREKHDQRIERLYVVQEELYESNKSESEEDDKANESESESESESDDDEDSDSVVSTSEDKQDEEETYNSGSHSDTNMSETEVTSDTNYSHEPTDQNVMTVDITSTDEEHNDINSDRKRIRLIRDHITSI
ncbi:CSN-associated deubiquitinating enzyme Ubp12 [Maudiozyma exigua]|uniref:ubiquitinyl hydrolase 1 n=1 Tax=Maudiozyma exigua TaxID=34358 RepID=A0A9P6WGZ3_MAUEX|nr:CSN-associated deubiquitinating enzyme Ubp12 [Kazachstania exigua]